MDLLSDLNEPQRRAVTHTGSPLIVFAGAGSGKTRVITRRIAHALATDRVRPHEVVALTFTNKAAREMVHRIDQLHSREGRSGSLGQSLTVGTFHSTCSKWLRMYGPRFGLKGDFVIYDDDDQRSLIRRVLTEMNLSTSEIPPKAVAVRIDQAKNRGQRPKDFKEEDGFGPLARRFPDIYARYEERLRMANALDFGDLILSTAELLERDEQAREFFRDRYKMVLVDEYQDTNRAQYKLIRALVPNDATDLCVVGDDDQSIYKFRGAEIGNIFEFKRDFQNVTTILLEDNYRSMQSILDVSNAVIAHNRRREPKTLRASRPGGAPPELWVHASPHEEAQWLVRLIEDKRREGMSLADMVILFRQNALSRVYEEALTRARIPFILVGGLRFFERAEVKDALAYLRLLVHSESDIDLQRIINTPTRGIGDKTVDRLAEVASQSGVSMASLTMSPSDVLVGAGLSPAAAERVANFGEMLRQWQVAAQQQSPRQMLNQILVESRMEAALREEDTVESESRLRNLGELVTAVAEWQLQKPDGTIQEYLEELALLSDLDRAPLGTERVTMMTLHAAKGLEFKLVILTGLEDGVFPIVRDDTSDEDLEEERRLFYVGVTRAMDELKLSACQVRMLYGRTQEMPPSRFLFEIPRHMLTRFMGGAQVGGASAGGSSYPSHVPKPGTVVRHNLFGAGKVVDITNEDGKTKLVIEFDKVGVKKVVASFVERVG